MKKTILLFILYIMFTSILSGQNTAKIPLDHSVYEKWKTLQNAQISNNGQFVSYEINPQKGDGWLYIYYFVTKKMDSFPRGYEGKFSPNSNCLVFKIKPQYDSTRKLKLAKTKKEKMPVDTLAIQLFGKDSLIKIPRIKSYKIGEENTDWFAYLHEKELKEEKKAPKDTSKVKKEENKEKVPDTSKTEKPAKPKEKAKKDKDQIGTHLVIFNPLLDTSFKFKNCDDYVVAKKGGLIAFTCIKKDSIDSTALYVFLAPTVNSKMIENKNGSFKNLKTDDPGKQLTFLYSKDTTEKKVYALFYWNEQLKASDKIADTATKDMPRRWSPNENGSSWFSEDGSKLYFGTALSPVQDPKDTLLDDEKVKVDVWNWQDARIQTQQLKELKDDQKKTYLAVIDIKTKTLFQIADEAIENVSTIQKGNAGIILGYSNAKYLRAATWTEDIYNDLYLIDLKKKTKTLLLEKCSSAFTLSPGGNYLLWFEQKDSAWYCKSIKNNKTICLTKNIHLAFYDEDHDVPSLPSPYGFAGWTEDDKYFLVYDHFDIWKVDPTGKESSTCITKGFGRKNQISFRYVKLDKEAQFIQSKDNLLLKGINEKTKDEGFYKIGFTSTIDPVQIINSADRYSFPTKAKNANQIIWRKSNYKVYPDLWTSDLEFNHAVKISVSNPQQEKYLWGTVEPFSWYSLTGEKLNGLLYKPENFDPTKKYPMIVYFYEKYSDNIHAHYIPQPSYSVISFPVYNSNGYLVFIPDITYKTGYPGKSAYNAIISGTLKLFENSFVDKTRLGLQGQSWGGYQVAYLVTQTNLFTAAMAGAPVSNMTSAYGGIRWESGMARTFQYEKSQSRIGATLWEKPNLYLENSALFYADKIQTPLLIMSNDNDGAVPWYQGIELFNALRRLDKPAWLLCYNGDEHNLTKWPNRVDLSIRMKQFFDHYLKGDASPEWLDIGIPAIDKGKKNGYKIMVPSIK